MKKSFLLIILFTLIFLWLGNYSHAAVTCDDWTTQCAYTSLCDCNEDPPGTFTCNACKIPPPPQCAAWEILVGNGMWWQECCDVQCQNLRSSTPCSPPQNWRTNLLGVCACPTGYKPGTDPCQKCSEPGVCCGIQLNTSIPFIGNCIEDSTANKGPGETDVTWTTAFPTLMWSLTKILVTVILIVSFILIIVGGIMIATGNPSWGRKMIINVVIGIALLGASWVILRLINPNFFG